MAVYAAMLLAWSVADIVRYTYFVVLLGGKSAGVAVPTGLVWLRYVQYLVSAFLSERKPSDLDLVLRNLSQILVVLCALSGWYRSRVVVDAVGRQSFVFDGGGCLLLLPAALRPR